MRYLRLLAIGTAVPAFSIDQAEATAEAAPLCCDTDRQQRVLASLFRDSGVERRGCTVLEAAPEGAASRQSFYPPRRDLSDRGPTTAARMQAFADASGQLAVQASEQALESSDCAASEITHLITVSCSGLSAPGFDYDLIEGLSLPRDVARTHVGFMGCHGALNAIRVAKAFCDADPTARVLICAVELCSLHYQYGWSLQQVVANAIFADGAAALVCCSADTVSSDHWQVASQGSTVVPDTRELISWRIGDHGFEIGLSKRLPDVLKASLAPWVDRWLAVHGLSAADVSTWAIHPGGPRILDACEVALGLASELLRASRSVLNDYGNMSSPTILFILDRLLQSGAPRPCVALGFGPGVTIEAALLH